MQKIQVFLHRAKTFLANVQLRGNQYGFTTGLLIPRYFTVAPNRALIWILLLLTLKFAATGKLAQLAVQLAVQIAVHLAVLLAVSTHWVPRHGYKAPMLEM